MIDERISSGRRCSAGVEAGGAVVQVERAAVVVHPHVAAERAEDLEDLAHVGDVGTPSSRRGS
jgi:translation initiation factor 6 (eIF-6)